MDTIGRSAEAAEAEIGRFIVRMDTKRRDTEGERLEEELYAESARRHAATLREAARAEWTLYHEHMTELHTRLADEHREKAERLLGDEPRGAA
jgi:hypothetical protein